MQRLQVLLKTFTRKLEMKADYLEFMDNIIEKGHASPVPRDDVPPPRGRSWYLLHFATYHNTKPTIRVVFDSSCEFGGVSLNKVLLPGPDLMNNLTCVLMYFRKETVAVMCAVEQIFHSFHVDPQHRDFLHFLWFEANDPSKPIIENRMNVHLFGNGPSPAVATYGLCRTAADGEEEYGEEAKKFICRNFYVDDGLASLPTAQRAIDLVKSAQAILVTANLRLHKVVSNSVQVMEAFPTKDRAKYVRNLDLRSDSLPAQRSLGVFWDLETDAFTFKVSLPERPFTTKESCPSSTPSMTHLVFRYLSCSKEERYSSSSYSWESEEARTKPLSLRRSPSYHDDEPVDALERFSLGDTAPVHPPLLSSKGIQHRDPSGTTRLF